MTSNERKDILDFTNKLFLSLKNRLSYSHYFGLELIREHNLLLVRTTLRNPMQTSSGFCYIGFSNLIDTNKNCEFRVVLDSVSNHLETKNKWTVYGPNIDYDTQKFNVINDKRIDELTDSIEYYIKDRVIECIRERL